MKKHLLTLLAGASLACLATPASADSDRLLNTARDKWSALQSGRSPKSEPVQAQGAVETWGDPAPWRSDETEQRSAERLQRRAGLPARADATQPREVKVDERDVDARFEDRRVSKPGRESSQLRKSLVAAEREVTPEPVAATRKSPPARASRSAEERAYDRAAGVPAAAPIRFASCTNVRRAWEGAASLAERGMEEQAYNAYLRLLSSCNDEQELIGTMYQAQKHLSEDALEQLLSDPVMASPKLMAAVNTLKLQQMFSANRSREAARALALSREIRAWLLEQPDAGALEVSGWLEQRAKNSKAAEQLFRASLKVARDSEGARQGLVFALLAQGKVDAANREVGRLDSASAEEVRAEVLVAQARQSLERKRYAQALEQLDEAEKAGVVVDNGLLETRAWVFKGLDMNVEASELFLALSQDNPQDPALAKAAVDTLMLTRQVQEVRDLAKESSVIGDLAQEAVSQHLQAKGMRKEAAKLQGRTAEGYAGGASASVIVRSKAGDAGEGRLKSTALPVAELSHPVGEDSVLKLRLDHLRVNDGKNSATGNELRVGVQTKIEGVDVEVMTGVSKVGGSSKPVLDAQASVDTNFGRVGLRVSHLPMMDSVRSYAGVDVDVPLPPNYDTSQRMRVGRVMDTQASAFGSLPVDAAGKYKLDWTFGGGSVKGTNSYNNGYYKGSLALMRDMEHSSFSWLNAGPYLAVSSYEHDENQFKGAYGGYFSPKSDIGFGLAGNLLTHEGGHSLHKASGQLGYVSRGLYYGNDSGISLETSTQSAWLIAPHLILGAGVSFRASPGYTDFSLRLGVTVPFEARHKLFGSDLGLFKAQ